MIIFAFVGTASADQISIPNSFVSGNRALAAEVNENFAVLAAESNNQDARLGALADETEAHETRIAALEVAGFQTVSDQLFCVVFGNWPISGDAYPCTQLSDPTNIRSLTFAQVAAEGWIAVSVGGGGDNTNRINYIFSK